MLFKVCGSILVSRADVWLKIYQDSIALVTDFGMSRSVSVALSHSLNLNKML